MTRADFYILEDLAIDAAYRFACKLCLKAINRNTKVHLHFKNEVAVNTMDELMWNYPSGRFLPHDILSTQVTKSPIQLSCEEPKLNEGLLINLSEEIPYFFGRFDRVAEIIVQNHVSEGRERYKFYRDRGYPLQHHQLNQRED